MNPKTHYHHILSPLLLLLLLTPSVCAQSSGTITLNLATSNDETSATLSVPFNALFDTASSGTQNKGVEIQVSTGNGLPITQDKVVCQCFSDKGGMQPLGGTFNDVFPGTRIAEEEPVEIGSIFCSDEEGLKGHLAGKGVEDTAPSQGVAAAPPVVTTSEPPQPTSTSIGQTSTAATSPIATPTTSLNPNVQPPSSSAPSSSADVPAAFIRFALSTDPSDDSSTQMAVPIDSSIIATGSKRAASVEVVTVSGIQGGSASSSIGFICQAFADAEAKEPLAAGLRLEESVVLGATGLLETVGAVGCALLGGGGFGGKVGLIAV